MKNSKLDVNTVKTIMSLTAKEVIATLLTLGIKFGPEAEKYNAFQKKRKWVIIPAIISLLTIVFISMWTWSAMGFIYPQAKFLAFVVAGLSILILSMGVFNVVKEQKSKRWLLSLEALVFLMLVFILPAHFGKSDVLNQSNQLVNAQEQKFQNHLIEYQSILEKAKAINESAKGVSLQENLTGKGSVFTYSENVMRDMNSVTGFKTEMPVVKRITKIADLSDVNQQIEDRQKTLIEAERKINASCLTVIKTAQSLQATIPPMEGFNERRLGNAKALASKIKDLATTTLPGVSTQTDVIGTSDMKVSTRSMAIGSLTEVFSFIMLFLVFFVFGTKSSEDEHKLRLESYEKIKDTILSKWSLKLGINTEDITDDELLEFMEELETSKELRSYLNKNKITVYEYMNSRKDLADVEKAVIASQWTIKQITDTFPEGGISEKALSIQPDAYKKITKAAGTEYIETLDPTVTGLVIRLLDTLEDANASTIKECFDLYDKEVYWKLHLTLLNRYPYLKGVLKASMVKLIVDYDTAEVADELFAVCDSFKKEANKIEKFTQLQARWTKGLNQSLNDMNTRNLLEPLQTSTISALFKYRYAYLTQYIAAFDACKESLAPGDTILFSVDSKNLGELLDKKTKDDDELVANDAAIYEIIHNIFSVQKAPVVVETPAPIVAEEPAATVAAPVTEEETEIVR